MFKHSVVAKLWLAMVLMVILILLILGGLFSRLFEDFYLDLQGRKLVREGQVIADLVVSPGEEGEILQNLDLLERFLAAHVMVVDRAGLVRGGSPGMGMTRGMHMDLEGLEEVLQGRVLVHRGYHPRFGTAMLSAAVPVLYQGEVEGAVLLHAPLAPITETVAAVRRLILFGIGGAVAVATLLALVLSRTLSGPLLEMNHVARGMARGDFSRRVQVQTSDEVGRLGSTLNYLSRWLAQSLDSLSQEKEQLQNILTSMSDGVITFDPRGMVLLANPRARHLLGEGIPWDKPLSRWELSFLWELFQGVVGTGAGGEGLLTWKGRNVAVRLAPLQGTGGELRGVVALFQDVTQERELERLRREFVANVSHELRTPLTYLQGYGEALLDGLAANPAEERRYLEIILAETLRLRRLVEDLLDLAQMEAGRLELEMGEIEIPILVERVVGKIRPVIEEKGLELEQDLPGTLPPVTGDGDRLQQVLFNLLDNAIRHTPPDGRIGVTAREKGDMVEVAVSDTGSGISREELPFIWERFYKVDKARTRTTGGTGLGLAIVRNIVRAHGGEIRAESQVGKGTTFIFSLPVGEGKAE